MADTARHLDVLISGGFSAAYAALVPQFERSAGIPVRTGSGASQGPGPQTIAAQLARGVPADLVILSREGLAELIDGNRIVAGTDVDLAQVPLGVAVRAGAPRPDLGSVAAFKQMLLQVRSVAIPASTSGIWLMRELFPRLGLDGKLNLTAATRGTDATRMVAAGDVALAVMPVSEILHAPGVDYAGALVPEIQFVQTFSGAVVAGSRQIEAARALLALLASAAAAAVIAKSGMEPLARA